MIRILNVEPLGYCDEARAFLNELGEVIEAPLTRAELLSQVSDFDVLIVRLAHQIDQEVLNKGVRLKAIVTATTGTDHIDVGYADMKGTAILSLRGEIEFLRTINATAEHTWALLLTLYRRIPQAFAAVQRGEWRRDAFRGHELHEKRLGLVGLGRVGRKIAEYGLAFGMDVAAYDPYADEWDDGVQSLPTLSELLHRSDILSVHVPLNAETSGMIGAEELAHLPHQAVVINTSRGEVLDEAALAKALMNEQVAGAALDVLAHERDMEQRCVSPLLAYSRDHDNLIITPHISGATHESMAKTEVFMAQKLTDFLHNLQTATI